MVPLVILPSRAMSQAPETIPQPDLPTPETVSQSVSQGEPIAKKQVTRIFEPIWEDGWLEDDEWSTEWTLSDTYQEGIDKKGSYTGHRGG